MRLSEWRKAAPVKDAVGPKVSAMVDPVIAALGAEPDPHGWIAWGEEPAVRYSLFVPTPAGLITCYVRVSVPGEGPRASAKLVRWNRVQTGELAVETQAGHRLLSFQLEQSILKGADAAADRVAAFALEMFDAIDGRVRPEPKRGSKPAGRATAAMATAAKATTGRASAGRSAPSKALVAGRGTATRGSR